MQLLDVVQVTHQAVLGRSPAIAAKVAGVLSRLSKTILLKVTKHQWPLAKYIFFLAHPTVLALLTPASFYRLLCLFCSNACSCFGKLYLVVLGLALSPFPSSRVGFHPQPCLSFFTGHL